MISEIRKSQGNNWLINSKEVQLNGKFKTTNDVKLFLDEIKYTLENYGDLKEVINKVSFISATKLIAYFFPLEFENYVSWYISEKNFMEDDLNIEYIFNHLFDRELQKSKRTSGFTDLMIQPINKRLAEIRANNSSWSVMPEVDILLQKNINNNCQWIINGVAIGFRGAEYATVDIIRVLINDIYNTLINQQEMSCLFKRYPKSAIISLSSLVFPNEFKAYVEGVGEGLIRRNKLVSKAEITRVIFGENIKGANFIKEYSSIVNGVVEDLYKEQYESISTKINFNDDTWEIIFKDKNIISIVTLDFAFINKSVLKNEAKHFLYSKINNRVILESRYKSLKKTIPYLQEKCNINQASDINMIDIKKLYLFLKNQENISVSYLLQINASMKEFIDWVTVNSGKIKTIKPKTNYFNKISITNLVNMTEDTEYIPESVVMQMLEHIEDIRPEYQRLFIIMLNTGLHFKDVVRLKEDCYRYDDENNIHLLKFIQWKNLSRRRRAGLSDYVEIPIHEDIAKEVLKQLGESKKLKDKFNLSYEEKLGLEEIFIHENRNRLTIFSSKGFNNAINKMIEKNNIKTEDGELWHFTTRQCRKTLAVDMIMNQASPQEIAYYLVHGSENTTKRYYAEVRRYKLAEMNSEFWEKEFELMVPQEQLKEFTLEDRRRLFIDFKLQVREVELGKCMKPVLEGVCSKRTGKINCATCNKLCTGLAYLDKWEKLQKSQQAVVNDIVYMYKSLGVEDYGNYRQYQKELHLLNAYNDVIKKIHERFGGGEHRDSKTI